MLLAALLSVINTVWTCTNDDSRDDHPLIIKGRSYRYSPIDDNDHHYNDKIDSQLRDVGKNPYTVFNNEKYNDNDNTDPVRAEAQIVVSNPLLNNSNSNNKAKGNDSGNGNNNSNDNDCDNII